MQGPLIVGVIILVGFVFGEIATRFRFPKVTGYILAGIVLNPSMTGFVPKNFPQHTNLISNISLSLITFSVGGTLFYPRVKALGKSILCITLFEAECAFLMVCLGCLAVLPFFVHLQGAAWLTVFLPMSLLLASLASPTDPSATLAVAHEYKAKGEVTSTIMGVAALDDVTGIVNYSIATVIASALIAHAKFDMYTLLGKPAIIIGGAVFLGIAFGLIFNAVSAFVNREGEGVLIVVIVGLLSLCFGCATLLKVDELLSTMTMGIVVVNLNRLRDRVFEILERYTEELIFVLFFTLSGMQLNFGVLAHSIIIVAFFVLFRAAGKVTGTITGAHISNASVKVKKYAAFGLIPQGGIVIGLALMVKQEPAFGAFADIILSVTIGATVIHELAGPVLSKMAMEKAGEINIKTA